MAEASDESVGFDVQPASDRPTIAAESENLNIFMTQFILVFQIRFDYNGEEVSSGRFQVPLIASGFGQ